MKKKTKIILAAVLALALAGGGAWYALSPIAVETLTLEPAPASLTFTEQGVCVYRTTTTVYPLVAGEVLEVYAAEGQPVKAGQAIALVSATDYDYQIRQLESAIAGYQGQISNLYLTEQQRKDEVAAGLENLQGQLVSLEAEAGKNLEGSDSLQGQIDIQQMIVNQNEYHVRQMRDALEDAKDEGDDYAESQARQALNVARNTLSQSELLLEQLKAGEVPQDVYEGQKQSLQAQMNNLQAQLGKNYTGGMAQFYNAQIAAAQANIEQMREKSGQAEITAPMDGVVSALPVQEQNVLSPQSPVAVLGKDPVIEVFVPLRDLDGVGEGDAVELILEKRTGKETMAGTVSEIASEAQVKLSALGVEERKVRVRILPEQSLPVGYELDVRFTVQQWESALVVPKTAVFTKDGADFVWVLENGALTTRRVVTGTQLREGYTVEEGLSPGETILRDANNEAAAEGKRAKALS